MLFMSWNAELAYLVTPKSGPMRAMRTLRDINYALLDDLTPQCRYRRHWFLVGKLLMAAATSEGRLAVMLATDALVMALEVEGWMTLQPRRRDSNILHLPVLTPRPEADELHMPMADAA